MPQEKFYMAFGVIDCGLSLDDVETLYSEKFDREDDGYAIDSDVFGSSIGISRYGDRICVNVCGMDRQKVAGLAEYFVRKTKIGMEPAPDWLKGIVAATVEKDGYCLEFVDIP